MHPEHQYCIRCPGGHRQARGRKLSHAVATRRRSACWIILFKTILQCCLLTSWCIAYRSRALNHVALFDHGHYGPAGLCWSAMIECCGVWNFFAVAARKLLLYSLSQGLSFIPRSTQSPHNSRVCLVFQTSTLDPPVVDSERRASTAL